MIYKLYIIVVCVCMISSCSEGDTIDITVDFEGMLENCSNVNDNTFVFFKTSDPSTRALSVNFTSTSFDSTPEIADISTTEPTSIPLSATNQFIYREFDTNIVGADYYCNSIPPSGINVTNELISSNGTLEISYTLIADNMYTRTVTLKNITLSGNGIAIRRELIELGSDTIEVN